MNRQDRARETRGRLLVSAAELFDVHGFTGTGMAELIERSGLSTPAYYFQFPSKEVVARELMTLQQEQWQPLLAGAVALREADRRSALDLIVGVSFLVGRRFRDDVVTRAGARLAQERAAIETELPDPFTPWLDQVTDLLILAQKEQTVSISVDAPAAGRLIVATCVGIQQVSSMRTQYADIEERIAEAWPLLLGGLCRAEVDVAAAVHAGRALADQLCP